jgi:hypothetical protein
MEWDRTTEVMRLQDRANRSKPLLLGTLLVENLEQNRIGDWSLSL